MRLTYKDICAVGTGLVLIGTSFCMGVFFANQTYDYSILFDPTVGQENFDNALRHYQTLFYTPRPVLYALLAVVAIGLIGSLIRVYKPNPDMQLFEYASLGMYVLGVCVFITNIKTGIDSSVSGEWGEVTQNQGLAVIGSSNIILMIVFAGVIVLQAGLWYTNWDYEYRLKEFFAKEEAEAVKASGKDAKGTKEAKAETKKAK
ncbi:LAMI_0H00452g1_1 [Lachancea mirantina]|uniref:LAMI_0H00452g1_1 n=1 Tax=Lachancea mirantina TaxID=1230905 RepID=A0A1G4KDG3_9SACH|nr:LAMI_0H00452g1_1 [Lachancea mirantina]